MRPLIYAIFVLLFLSTQLVHAQTITTVAGKGTFGFSGEGGPAINAEFDFLAGITTDKFGNIYIADRYNRCPWNPDKVCR
jgi:hypothetical protein